MVKLAFIIATKDRQMELRRLLQSLQGQSWFPDEIIIVDASREPAIDRYAGGEAGVLTIKYARAERACLPAQRNQGVGLLGEDINLVCFLDDDIVFCPGSLQAMRDFWLSADAGIAGAVLNIVNEKKPTAGVFLKKLFVTGGPERGAVLWSGYNTLMCPASHDMVVQWLFGGATVWRRAIFKEFLFDDWFEGTGLCEDLDFSYRVGRKYRLHVVAGARVEHLTGNSGRRRNVWFGRSQIKNRYYFVRKNRLSVGLFLWASMGQLLENLVLGIVSLDRHYLLRTWGNCVGFFELMKVEEDVRKRGIRDKSIPH